MASRPEKYRQYDEEDIISKIRSYRTQRYPDQEIMKKLDNMPRRTYYNFVKKIQQQDLAIMKRWMEENVEQIAEDHFIFRENLCKMVQHLQAIIADVNTPARVKVQAIEQHIAIESTLTQHDQNILQRINRARAKQLDDIVNKASIDSREELRSHNIKRQRAKARQQHKKASPDNPASPFDTRSALPQ